MSIHADRGTAAHKVLEICLQMIYQLQIPTKASSYEGSTITIDADQPGDHAVLSPSGAKRWMSCSKAPEMATKYPEPLEPERTYTLDAEDCDAIQDALDYVDYRVRYLRETYKVPVEVLPERRVSTSRITGSHDTDGTSDITIRCDVYCEHIDYKHGSGVLVEADDPQNAIYFIGTCAEVASQNETGGWLVPYTQARLTIVQPRCTKAENTIRWIDINNVQHWFDLWLDKLTNAIAATHPSRSVYNPGEDACRWCPVGGSAHYTGNPVCEAYANYCLGQMGIVPDEDGSIFQSAVALASTPLETLSTRRLLDMLDVKDMLAGLIKAVEARATHLLLCGAPDPDLEAAYKVVESRTRRVWADESEDDWERHIKAIKIDDPETGKTRALKKAERYTTQRMSPAQLENSLKRLKASPVMLEAFRALVTKPKGKYALVTIDDPRAPVPESQPPDDPYAELPPVEVPAI